MKPLIGFKLALFEIHDYRFDRRLPLERSIPTGFWKCESLCIIRTIMYVDRTWLIRRPRGADTVRQALNDQKLRHSRNSLTRVVKGEARVVERYHSCDIRRGRHP